MISTHVGRIVVPAFTQGTGRQVRASLRDLQAQHATGVVLDLRGDPGGLLSEAVETASAFLDGGAVVSYARRDERAQRLDAAGHGDTTTPLVVLVDGSTASAAEVVAGALQDRGRAVVVGARTFGKGTVQEPHLLPDGSSLALTVASYTLPSGRSVEGVGIEPDIQVFEVAAALNRAVEVLSGLVADTGSGRG
jgi:carboxyl-terminal processing protease